MPRLKAKLGAFPDDPTAPDAVRSPIERDVRERRIPMTQKRIDPNESPYRLHHHYQHETSPASGRAAAVALVEEGSAFLHLTKRRADGALQADARPATTAAARDGETLDAIVIGAGQAGLSVGYYLAKRGARFVILNGDARVGDSWRNRWDSLRLFTPARWDGLAGMPFPAPPRHFPTKNEMADYLESYARRFALPVQNGMRVERLSREEDRYVAEAGRRRFEAPQVVVAMSSFQKPAVPGFASGLDPGVVQLHSSEYRNLSQLRDGGVLIVGAGNSGAEIAAEVARGHETWVSGRDVGQVPFRVENLFAQLVLIPVLFRIVFHRLLSLATPFGRRLRPKAMTHGDALIRTKRKALAAAGVQFVPRVAGVRDGKPLLEDGRLLNVTNVVWCTGFHPGFSWIDFPIFDEHGEPEQFRGVVESHPGLFFVGLFFLYAMSSSMVQGVHRDARYVADALWRRARQMRKAAARSKSGIVTSTRMDAMRAS
jgi:putative flavoprotein involved in K+ transport